MKKMFRELTNQLNKEKNLINNKKRQIDLLSNKLTRLDMKMLPIKATLEIFAAFASNIWAVYSETLTELIRLCQHSTTVPNTWTHAGMGLGHDHQLGRERSLFSKDITTFVPAMFQGDEKRKKRKEKHTKPSPVTEFIVCQWNRPSGQVKCSGEGGEDGEGGEGGEGVQVHGNEVVETKQHIGENPSRIAAAVAAPVTTTTAAESHEEVSTTHGLLTFFGTRQETFQHLLPVSQRSQKTDRSEHLSATALLHHFLLDSGQPNALTPETTQVLQQEINKEQQIIQHAVTRSVELDADLVAGQYISDVSGLTRSQLAVHAVNEWKKASKTYFLQGGLLGTALTSGNNCNGSLKLGAHVQGWHMLSRHCHTVKERKKRRNLAKSQEEANTSNVDVLSLAVRMYGTFDRKRLVKIIEADMLLRADKRVETLKAPVNPLDLARELDALEALTLQYAPEIRGWYIRYSSMKGMGTHDFYLFVKKIKVLSKSFHLVDIDLVRVASGAGDGDDILSPPEFVEALIRLAIRRYTSAPLKDLRNEALTFSEGEEEEEEEEEEDEEEGNKLEIKSKRPVDRVRRLLVENVQEYAHQVDIDSFRTRFNDPEVQAVLSKRRRWLLGKFREYCAADGAQASAAGQLACHTMNLVEWDKFLREHMMFDHRFKNRLSATIFVCAQAPHALDEDGSLEEALESNQELIYQEFLEAIVALAHFRLPDPFVPLCSRISTMLDQMDEAKPLNRYFASSRFSGLGGVSGVDNKTTTKKGVFEAAKKLL